MKGLRTMNNKTKKLQDMYEVYRREYGSEMEYDYYYYDDDIADMIASTIHCTKLGQENITMEDKIEEYLLECDDPELEESVEINSLGFYEDEDGNMWT